MIICTNGSQNVVCETLGAFDILLGDHKLNCCFHNNSNILFVFLAVMTFIDGVKWMVRKTDQLSMKQDNTSKEEEKAVSLKNVLNEAIQILLNLCS